MTGRERDGGANGGELVIVVGHPDGRLTSAWFRAYQRVERTMSRGSFHARVELAPISAPPARIDVLIVPPGLDPIPAAAAHAERLVATPEGLRSAFDELVARLLADGRLIHAPAPSRAIAIHRGFRAVGRRARLAD